MSAARVLTLIGGTWVPLLATPVAVVQVSGDYLAVAGDCVTPKLGLGGYAVDLPLAADAPNGWVVCVRDPMPGAVVKVRTQGSDIFLDGSNVNVVDDQGGFGLRYAGLYLSDGVSTWVTLA